MTVALESLHKEASCIMAERSQFVSAVDATVPESLSSALGVRIPDWALPTEMVERATVERYLKQYNCAGVSIAVVNHRGVRTQVPILGMTVGESGPRLRRLRDVAERAGMR